MSRRLLAALGTAAALIFGLVAVPAATAATGTAEVSGAITDPSGKAVSNARLSLAGTLPDGSATASSATTDSTGHYDITGLPGASYFLSVTPPAGTKLATLLDHPFTLAGGQKLALNLNLQYAATLTGTVVTAAGVPASGVNVLIPAHTYTGPSTTTDATGHYTLGGVPGGTFAVQFISPTGASTFSSPIAVTPGTTVVLNQRLDPVGVILRIPKPTIKRKGNRLKVVLATPVDLIQDVSWYYPSRRHKVSTKRTVRLRAGCRGKIQVKVHVKAHVLDPAKGIDYVPSTRGNYWGHKRIR